MYVKRKHKGGHAWEESYAHLGRFLEDGLALGVASRLGPRERIEAIVVLLVDVAVGVDEELEQRGVVTDDSTDGRRPPDLCVAGQRKHGHVYGGWT